MGIRISKMKKKLGQIRLKFVFSIDVPFDYDLENYSDARNKRIEKAIKKWLSTKNIKSSITNGNGTIPFYVEKDETGAMIEETTKTIQVNLDEIWEV